MSLSHHPTRKTTIITLQSTALTFSFPIFSFSWPDPPWKCPYDSTRPSRQCVRRMGDSQHLSRVASAMAITVKAMAPIRRSFLQSECKTREDQTLATQTQLQEQDLMPHRPVTFLLRCIRRSCWGWLPSSSIPRHPWADCHPQRSKRCSSARPFSSQRAQHFSQCITSLKNVFRRNLPDAGNFIGATSAAGTICTWHDRPNGAIDWRPCRLVRPCGASRRRSSNVFPRNSFRATILPGPLRDNIRQPILSLKVHCLPQHISTPIGANSDILPRCAQGVESYQICQRHSWSSEPDTQSWFH